MFLLATLFASLALSVTASPTGVPNCEMTWPAVGMKAPFMNANFMGVKAEAFTVTLSKDMNKDKLTLTAVGDGNILGFVASAKEAGSDTVGGMFSGAAGKQPTGNGCGAGWYTHPATVNAVTTEFMFEPTDTTKSYEIEVYALIGASGSGLDRSFFLQTVTVGPPAAGGTTTPAGTTPAGTTPAGTTAAVTTGPGGSTNAPAAGTTDEAAPAAEAGACTKCVGEGKTWCVVGLTREQDTGSCKDSADDCGFAAGKLGDAITDAKMCIKDLNDECEALTKDMDDNLAECKACVAKPGCGACSTAGAAAGVIGVGDRLAGLSCSYIGEDGEDGCVNPLLTPIKTEAECDSASAVLLSGLAAVVALVSQF